MIKEDFCKTIELSFDDSLTLKFNIINHTTKKLLELELHFDDRGLADFVLLSRDQTDQLIQTLLDLRRDWGEDSLDQIQKD